MFTLRVMTADELAGYLAGQADTYAAELVESGEPEAVARERASQVFAESFPDGRSADGHQVFTALDDGVPVGVVWVGPHPRRPDDATSAWIFDIGVDEGRRGHGYGRQLLAGIEDELRGQGVTELGLNVFGDNEVARSLYRSSGYREVAVVMSKSLST